MKITKITINSFGNIVNWNSPDMKENMTLVTGRNEAGKSTIMEFIRSTIFPVRSFKYPAASRTDSGSIDIVMDNGDERELIRKQKKVTEKDGKRTIPEEFPGMDADTYRSLYALDLEQLTNSKVISSGEFRSKFLTVPGGEHIPEVAAEIDEKLGQLMNKEKMTDNKIIGHDIKELRDVNDSISKLEAKDNGYDNFVAERTHLERQIDEKRNVEKMSQNARTRRRVLLSQSDNVDKLNDLKLQRKDAEHAESIQLESKAEFDDMKRKIKDLTAEKESISPKMTEKGSDIKKVLREKTQIEDLWKRSSGYNELLDQKESMMSEINDANIEVDEKMGATRWSLKDAKRVKTGKYITDKAEAAIKKRDRGRRGSDGHINKRFTMGAAIIGILIIIAGVALFSGNMNPLIPTVLIGVAVIAVGIFIPKISERKSFDSDTADPMAEWSSWIASEGYPADTTPERACILAPKLESMVRSAERAEGIEKRIGKIDSSVAAFEEDVDRECEALGIEYDDARNDVKRLHDMLANAERSIADTDRYDKIEDELSDAESAMKKFLRKNGGTEEEYLRLYDDRLVLDQLDKDIATLTESIEKSSGISIGELISFYEKEGKNIEPEDTEINLDGLSRRVGEIDNILSSILDDGSMADLQTRKMSLETHLGESLREWAVYSVANHIISNSCDHFYTDLQPSVVKTANKYLGMMTDGRYQLDNDPRENDIVIRDAITKKSSSQWSSGLGDQVYLSVKMALVKEMGAEKLPLILDDILVRFDAERKQGACRAIYDFSRSQQVIMFTCDSSLYNYFSLEGRINDIRLSGI